MSIEVTALTELDTTRVASRRATISALLAEKVPELDLKRGVVHDILVHNQAILSEATAENIDRYNRARSLKDITADPTLADPDIVDGVLSNWGAVRLPGSRSTGTVTIVLSSAQLVTIALGAVFTVGDNQYTSNAAYTSRISGTVGVNDRELTPLSDGTYSFTIEVTAVGSGESYRLAKNTLLTPAILPSYFVKAYATEDFTGGRNEETNAELLERLRLGIAAKTLAGPTNIDALLRQHDSFAGVVSTSLVGMGDPEMLRDRHWIWPTAGGGRIDYYVRTQQRPQRIVLTKTATFVGVNAAGNGIWQIELTRDEAPGFYDVTQILLPRDSNVAGTFTISTDVRDTDLTTLDLDVATPDIVTAKEAAFSAYQTSVVRFIDDVTPTAPLTANQSTASYMVTLRYFPLIADLQLYLGGRDIRPGAADILVKAPVPCFVQLSFTIYKPAADNTITAAVLANIRNALAELVNTYGFTGRLAASVIAETVHKYIDNPASLGSIDMFGIIRRPDQTRKAIRSREMLVIPDEPANMVSARTTAFILEPSDVAISVENA